MALTSIWDPSMQSLRDSEMARMASEYGYGPDAYYKDLDEQRRQLLSMPGISETEPGKGNYNVGYKYSFNVPQSILNSWRSPSSDGEGPFGLHVSPAMGLAAVLGPAAFAGLGGAAAGAGTASAAEQAAALAAEPGSLTGAAGAGAGTGTSVGASAGAAGGTAAGAAGSGGVDWWTELGLTPQDVGLEANPFTTNPSVGDLGGNIGSSSFDFGSLADKVPGGLKTLLSNPGILGAAGGALLGGMGASSKPAGTTTTVQDIPDWLKPYVIGNMNAAGGTRDSLLSSGGVTSAAMPEYLKTITGAYLDPATNPYLDATFTHAANLVGANVDSRFEAAGRYGSGAHQGVLQEGFNNLANNIYGGNYQAERARQNAAVTGAPAFDTGRSGAAFAPFIDYSKLFPSGSRATTAPYFNNTAGGILSGALAGSQISKMLS